MKRKRRQKKKTVEFFIDVSVLSFLNCYYIKLFFVFLFYDNLLNCKREKKVEEEEEGEKREGEGVGERFAMGEIIVLFFFFKYL